MCTLYTRASSLCPPRESVTDGATDERTHPRVAYSQIKMTISLSSPDIVIALGDSVGQLMKSCSHDVQIGVSIIELQSFVHQRQAFLVSSQRCQASKTLSLVSNYIWLF